LLPEEKKEILEAIKDPNFREFVLAMQETGARPSEVRRVTAQNVNLELGIWVFYDHKTIEKTGRSRIVYLTPAMVELSKKLVVKYPEGPLFRGPRSKRGFTRNGVRCRFRNLRLKLPHLKGVIAYAYRHSFATDALTNGVGVAQVAELLGHTNTDMVMRHYQHLRERTEYLRQAAEKAARPPEAGCA
jgi:integrase